MQYSAVVLVQALNRQGWKAVAVHGDASQAQRTAAVDSFKVRTQMQGARHAALKTQRELESAQQVAM